MVKERVIALGGWRFGIQQRRSGTQATLIYGDRVTVFSCEDSIEFPSAGRLAQNFISVLGRGKKKPFVQDNDVRPLDGSVPLVPPKIPDVGEPPLAGPAVSGV